MSFSLSSSIPNVWATSQLFSRPVNLANGTFVVNASAATCSSFASQVMEDDASVLVGTYSRAPVVVARGKGCMVYDHDGKEYLDMGAGIAVNALGHGDPDWVRAVVEQANLLTHASNTYYSVPQVELAKRLVDCSFADRVFFVNSGTEANEAAIKFSRKFQRCAHPDEPRTGFVSFTNSFHGRTMGALALTSKDNYRTPFEPVMPGVVFLEYGDTEGVTELIRSGGSGIAAVFVEPVQGEGGIHSVTREFIQTLRDCCSDAGVLLVFDEVQCGLGRTGHLWAHEMYYGVKPDMMTLAKPLAGGLPIGAVLLTERVAASIARGDHGSTFAGGPLVCEAAIAVLKKISNPHFLSDVVAKGHHLRQLLSCELGGHHHVKEIRGHGLMFGVELNVPAAPFVDACRRSGLLVLTAGKGNVVRLTPPLVISKEELHRAVRVMSDCLKLLE